MKKNITINMCGRLFAIDEDAYELLNHYTETLRGYFSKQDGGDEIANDIEERIAELLDELKAQGVAAITIEHIQDIIKRIGDLKDITDNENDDDNDDKNDDDNKNKSKSGAANSPKKQLFLNPNDKMVAGVLGGCAQYFGGSSLVWRILFVASAFAWILWTSILALYFFYGLPVIVYVLMAILVPSPKTPEDRLKMKGKEVNVQNLAEEVAETSKQEEANANGKKKGSGSGFFSILSKIFHVFGIISTFLTFGIPGIVFFCMLIAMIFVPTEFVTKLFNEEVAKLYADNVVGFWMLGVSIVATCFIPTYCAIHSALKMLGSVPPMKIWQRVTWIGAWVLSVAGIVASGISVASVVSDADDIIRERRDAEYRKYVEEHTIDGIFYNQEGDYEFLRDGGWTLLKHENCDDDRYTSSGKYYNGDESVRYLDAYSFFRKLVYQAERTDTVAPGYYRLTAIGRCSNDDTGAYIYALSGEGDNAFKSLALIPAFDNGIETEYDDEGNEIEVETDSTYLDQGWSIVAIDSIPVRAGEVVKYGVSTDAAFTGKKCTAQWFSATDFKLQRIGDLK
ncbi:MAG: PspC domain-containing protein [Prevotellaceae bacterium]|nr:PspC domain-containing protein [Candidatus Minthosoma caballi]